MKLTLQEIQALLDYVDPRRLAQLIEAQTEAPARDQWQNLFDAARAGDQWQNLFDSEESEAREAADLPPEAPARAARAGDQWHVSDDGQELRDENRLRVLPAEALARIETLQAAALLALERLDSGETAGASALLARALSI